MDALKSVLTQFTFYRRASLFTFYYLICVKLSVNVASFPGAGPFTHAPHATSGVSVSLGCPAPCEPV